MRSPNSLSPCLLFIHLPLSLPPSPGGFSLLLITITSSLPTCLSLPSPTSFPASLASLLWLRACPSRPVPEQRLGYAPTRPPWGLDRAQPRPESAPRDLALLRPDSSKPPEAWHWKRGLWHNHPWTPGQKSPQPIAEGGPFCSQWRAQDGLGVEEKAGVRAGSQVPRSQGLSLPVAPQPRLSLSPNLHVSRTSRSVAVLRLFAPSHLSPGVRVGPARGCQGELSDSGSGGRLRGRSET